MAKTKVTELNRFLIDELGLPFTVGYPVFSLTDAGKENKTHLKLSPRSEMPFRLKGGLVEVTKTDRGQQPQIFCVKPENIQYASRFSTYTMSRLFTRYVSCKQDEIYSKIKFYDRRYRWCEDFFHGEDPCGFQGYVGICRVTSEAGNWLRHVQDNGIEGVYQAYHTKVFNSLCQNGRWKTKYGLVDRRFDKEAYLSKAAEFCEAFLTEFDRAARLSEAYGRELDTITDKEYLHNPGEAVKLYDRTVQPISQYELDISFHVS
jgi:hypothetical protein